MSRWTRMLLYLFLRVGICVPLMLMGIQAMRNASGNWHAVSNLLIGFVCIIVGGLILAPGVAGILAEPWGRLYFPEKKLRRNDARYRRALASMACGRYVEAIAELKAFAVNYERKLIPYMRMMDIAVEKLQDKGVAKQVYTDGLRAISRSGDLRLWKGRYLALQREIEIEPIYRPKIAIDPDELAREVERKLRARKDREREQKP